MSFNLTPSETTALTLAARGYSMRESASAQRLSAETVKRHLGMARLKLGARNTTHAAVIASHRGLIAA